jgi:hypothetical protein
MDHEIVREEQFPFVIHFAPADNPLIFTARPLCAGFSLT